MTSAIVALDKHKHKNTRVKHDKTLSIAKDQHLILLQAHEFINASTCYPIVFIKDTENGEFRSVAMLGLEPKENLFFDASGWSAYIPAVLRNAPFALIPKPQDPDQYTVLIDMNSNLVSETEGEKLFDEAGIESDYLNNAKELMSTFVSQTPVTKAFIDHLTRKQLLKPMSLSINIDNDPKGSYSLNGIYVVDNKALAELSDSDFLDLRKRGYLPAIYAHIVSISLVSKLAQQKAKNNNLSSNL